ncbi:TPT-domain-containing protein [Gloeophyllum trabeum ATCC 11539]|uniref:TPT-domain-containing protein n=1 Tax=Gloeophyllum trabeum (strain ATCC 11539 / FP-39264 / Madison 617) TaxID=670483 RepID=S7RGZ8_GLOTA|nr:TPT-domain-containing protein [Gloeophyllum trabeum ATCC 11539]EPQ51849.1 TPT-domain-containing protein [Gloeophyllum trabeum ATCC 11539]
MYFCFNLGLTLYNKGVLVRFPFPYTLTAIHALCGSIGGYFLLARGMYVPAKLSSQDNAALVAFSVLYAMNIAVSNVSLQLVTVPFHQVVRASTPIFTIFLSYLFYGTLCSREKMISLIPVIVGVGFATYGDYYFTTWGLILTLFGTFLAALKTIFTNVLQSPPISPLSPSTPAASPPPKFTMRSFLPPRLHLHPLDLLTRMSPLAFIQCVLYAQLSGELDRVKEYSAREMTGMRAATLLVNGAIAFGLNIVSFTANKKAGPLSMTVAANVKQVLTIALAMFIFHLPPSMTNTLGIVLTLLGGAWYAATGYEEKRNRARAAEKS